MSDDWLRLLLAATLVSTSALGLAYALRAALQQLFGAGVAYLIWLLVPASLLGILLPADSTVTAAFVPVALKTSLSTYR